ncbi:unnamed protein product [Pedinophyceae sp. YPF-701]|nr:unnamed protein product [Pedinophyceae sp. YPF-701]
MELLTATPPASVATPLRRTNSTDGGAAPRPHAPAPRARTRLHAMAAPGPSAQPWRRLSPMDATQRPTELRSCFFGGMDEALWSHAQPQQRGLVPMEEEEGEALGALVSRVWQATEALDDVDDMCIITASDDDWEGCGCAAPWR